MEDIAWKKDETPYIIFACNKCQQYTYVKCSQKSKKCVRCGHTQSVSKITDRSIIVNGISSAVEFVKMKQNELAIKELGSEPEFRTSRDFIVPGKVVKLKKFLKSDSVDSDYFDTFKTMLYNLSETHKSFPYYIIEIMAENYGIPLTEVKFLTRKFLKNGNLIRKNGEFVYKIKV